MFALADATPKDKDFRFFAYLDTGQVALARNDLRANRIGLRLMRKSFFATTIFRFTRVSG
jgi:hypothetical protein